MVVIGVGVIGGFALLAVVSTLSLITVGRRPEFRLLRMVGAGRRQVRRMLVLETGLVTVAGLAIGTLVAAVPLLAFAVSVTGSLPYICGGAVRGARPGRDPRGGGGDAVAGCRPAAGSPGGTVPDPA